MASGVGQSDFTTNNVAADKTAPDGFDRQVVVVGTAGQNATLDLSALLGSTSEAAPAADTTAGVGHNGRLQRIAQRLTSILSVLPANLGQLTKAASFPVVLPSDYNAPIIAASTAAATVSWTSATPLNSVLSIAVQGVSSVFLALNPTTTFTGGVLTFEASPDGASWYPITAVRIDSLTAEGSYAIVASTPRAWRINVGAAANFRVRLSTVITGTGTAALTALVAADATEPIVAVGGPVNVRGGAANDYLAIRLTDGTSFYSAVGVKGTALAVSTVTVGTSATLLAAANANRKSLALSPQGATTVFVGPSTVTTANGTDINNSKPWEDAVTTAAWYGIVASATADVRVLEAT